jgi:hypothetical protein
LALVINLLIGWIDGWTGASRHGLLSGWPIAAQVAFFVISHDLYIYWFHRFATVPFSRQTPILPPSSLVMAMVAVRGRDRPPSGQ